MSKAVISTVANGAMDPTLSLESRLHNAQHSHHPLINLLLIANDGPIKITFLYSMPPIHQLRLSDSLSELNFHLICNQCFYRTSPQLPASCIYSVFRNYYSQQLCLTDKADSDSTAFLDHILQTSASTAWLL